MSPMATTAESKLFDAAAMAFHAAEIPVGHVPIKVIMLTQAMNGEGVENIIVLSTSMNPWEKVALLRAELLRAEMELMQQMMGGNEDTK